MSDINTLYRYSGSIFDRTLKDRRISLFVAVALSLCVAAITIAVLARDGTDPLVLATLAALSVLGVFSLFGLAIGLLQFSESAKDQDLKSAYADLMDDGLLITSPDDDVLFANKTYMQLFTVGRTGDVLTIKQAFTGNPAISENIFRLSRAQQGGKRWQEEIRIPARTDDDMMAERPRWLRISVKPIAAANAHSRTRPNSVWQISDITGERLRQEESYQKLQEAIENLDHAPAGFFSASSDGRIDHINATLSQWLGADSSRINTGQLQIVDIMRANGAALLACAAEDSLRSGEPRTQEFKIDFISSDGRSFSAQLLARATPVTTDRTQIRAIVLKETKRTAAYNYANPAEMRFARFFHSAPIAIATVDSAGRIGNTNGSFVRMFNRPKAGMIKVGDSLFDITGQAEREDLERALASATAGEIEITPVDITIGPELGRNGRFFISPIEQVEQDSEVAVVYAIETTEQKALEIQIAQSQKMQAVGQLAGGIAHDFNNVLTAIIGFSDLLLTSHRPTDPAFKDIMNIKQNANRAAGLVRQLLAFSRQQTLRPEVLSLTDVISDLQVLLSRLLGEKIALKVIHGRDLWFVKADVNQFEQVIINLAVNARDAMQGLGGQLTIRTENTIIRDARGHGDVAMEPGEYVLCEVTDTGCGIPEEIIEKIFEPFFSTKEVGKGTGLGLSTVYGIVKQTGGYVFTESEVEQGTTFKIYLPRHHQEIQEDTDTAAANRTDRRDKPRDLTGTGCVLLVEDEEAVRSFAARALTGRGYNVLEAATGLEALEVMEAYDGHVDLVVSDVVMPEMDGPSLLKELRKSNPELKIIFISGYAEDAFRKNLGEDEQFVFLPKPFSLKQLAGAVKEVLQS